MTRRAAAEAAWIAASIAMALVAAAAIDPRIVGLYHDDGLYVAAAEALARTGEYRTSSVPGAPFQTKYPPLYAFLLSIVWRAAPEFPRNVPWLKAPNVACIALALLGVSRLARRLFPSAPARSGVLAMLMLATSPGVALFAANFATSDALFMALVVWIVLLSMHGEGERTPRREVLLAALTAASILTRSVGIAIGAALAVESALRRRWRAALVHSVAATATFGAWAAWAVLHRSTSGNPLLVYYQSYETTALGYLLRDPALSWSIVSGNARIVSGWSGLVASPALLGAGAIYLAVGAWGAHELWRERHAVLVVVPATYLAVVLVYPFTPLRYLIPVLPLAYLAILAAPRRVGSRAVAAALAAALAVPLVGANVAWIRHALRTEASHVRGWSGEDLGYGWEGFEESFRWIRRNTAPGARVASMFDPMYFLYTGRQGIRPWLHHPETYFYPRGAERPYVGTPEEVTAALRDLRVEYVALDPPAGFAEGNAAMELLGEIVRDPELGASLAFTSSDARHRIYRLRGATSPEGPSSRRDGGRPAAATTAPSRPPRAPAPPSRAPAPPAPGPRA